MKRSRSQIISQPPASGRAENQTSRDPTVHAGLQQIVDRTGVPEAHRRRRMWMREETRCVSEGFEADRNERAERVGDKRTQARDVELRRGPYQARIGGRRHRGDSQPEKHQVDNPPGPLRGIASVTLQHERRTKRDRPDRAEHMHVCQQPEQQPGGNDALRLVQPQGHEAEAEQRQQHVSPADDKILPEQKIAHQQQEFLDHAEGRPTEDHQPRRERQCDMHDLHPYRIGREARQDPYQQMPEARMSFVFELEEQIPGRRTGGGQHENLKLVSPHRMPKGTRDVDDGENRECHDGDDPGDVGRKRRSHAGAGEGDFVQDGLSLVRRRIELDNPCVGKVGIIGSLSARSPGWQP